MSPRVIKVDPASDCTDAVREAVEALAAGGLVIFPTETVYGLGARADRPQAVQRLREFKSRHDRKPFTIHVGRKEDAAKYAGPLTGVAARMISKGWPGPLTLIIPVADLAVRHRHLAGGDTGWKPAPEVAACTAEIYHDNAVGLRCPDDPVASRLLREVDAPVVATSANRAGEPAPRCVEEAPVEAGDLVLDAGPARYARPSTIARLNGSTFEVVREGVYDLRTLQRLASLNILFVCSGNTCRSPMAAAFCKRHLAQRLGCSPEHLHDHHVYVDSAGAFGYNGGSASSGAVAVMARCRMDLSTHQSRPLTVEGIRSADHIFVMTRSHREAVIDLQPSAAGRVELLLGDRELADPFGGSEATYEECAKAIDAALPKRLEGVTL